MKYVNTVQQNIRSHIHYMFLTALNLPAQAVQAHLQFPDHCPGEHIAQFCGIWGQSGCQETSSLPQLQSCCIPTSSS